MLTCSSCGFGHKTSEELRACHQTVAPNSEPSIPADYKFKTSEEAELLPLPLQLLRLKDINTGLCDAHNTLVIMNARAEDRITELGETVARRESMLDRLSESNDNQLRRIAELEGALREAQQAYDDAATLIAGGNIFLGLKKLDGAFAALAAPSGVKEDSK